MPLSDEYSMRSEVVDMGGGEILVSRILRIEIYFIGTSRDNNVIMGSNGVFIFSESIQKLSALPVVCPVEDC